MSLGPLAGIGGSCCPGWWSVDSEFPVKNRSMRKICGLQIGRANDFSVTLCHPVVLSY